MFILQYRFLLMVNRCVEGYVEVGTNVNFILLKIFKNIRNHKTNKKSTIIIEKF